MTLWPTTSTWVGWPALNLGGLFLALAFFDLAFDARHHARIAVQDARLAQLVAEAAQLAGDVGLVDGQVVADLAQLGEDEKARGGQQRQRGQHDHEHGHGTRNAAPLEPRHHRVKHKAHQNRQRQRHEHVAPEVQRRDDDGGTDQPRCQRLPRGLRRRLRRRRPVHRQGTGAGRRGGDGAVGHAQRIVGSACAARCRTTA
ncbi:hypothetical protein R0D99_04820 [Ottowia sp. SB7-C50]|nr:hypothetical protein [Ottowia sp. SB7-C50]WOP16360.1 hypothetical protein R0D99_04820 [Ottowia sp. SB7-C50]